MAHRSVKTWHATILRRMAYFTPASKQGNAVMIGTPVDVIQSKVEAVKDASQGKNADATKALDKLYWSFNTFANEFGGDELGNRHAIYETSEFDEAVESVNELLEAWQKICGGPDLETSPEAQEIIAKIDDAAQKFETQLSEAFFAGDLDADANDDNGFGYL
jgi:hypothetical protein